MSAAGNNVWTGEHTDLMPLLFCENVNIYMSKYLSYSMPYYDDHYCFDYL